MKILQLCLRIPFPPDDGGTIAMFNMSRSLEMAGAEVKILSFNTRKHFVSDASIPVDFMDRYHPEMVYLDASVRPFDAMANLFGKRSYNIERFDISAMHQKVSEVLRQNSFDIIHLESLFMAPYLDTIRAGTHAPVFLRAHNVEFRIWERLAASCSNPLKKWYLQLLARRLKQYETEIINQFDGLIVLTEEDRDLFIELGCRRPILISPISLDTSGYPSSDLLADNKEIFHLGSMDWMPNIEGIEWFLQKVLPLLSNHATSLSIHLAGKAMPEHLYRLASKSMHISGKVEHAIEFMADKQIMIVPLLSGGGMRVKIIEGMAMGKTIISTRVGAEGIRYTQGKDILIASSADEFADAIIRCVTEEGLCRMIGNNARKLAQQIYDIRITGTEVMNFYTTYKQKSIEMPSSLS